LSPAAGCGPLNENAGRTNAEKGHTEEQIVYALRQAQAGKKVGDICRELGVSSQAFYSWKRRYAGLGLSELRELRQLREENGKLKTLVADLTLDKHILQEVLSKKLKPAARRELVRDIRQAYQLNESRACGLVGITRWINRYQSRRDPQDELRQRLRDLAGNRCYREKAVNSGTLGVKN
jgi:putative transposase